LIESRNLFRLQSKLLTKDKSIPVKTLEKNYILAWILVGIANLDMENLFVFKGGTALKMFFINNYRFSEDLDFTLLNPLGLEVLKEKLNRVYTSVMDKANIPIVFNRSEVHSNSYTIYVNFSGPLGASIERGEIKIDFTINELLLFPTKREKFFNLYEEYADIPRNVEILVYSIEEILIEKIISIIDPGRNEPRDVYDLWFLLRNGLVKLDTLKDSFIKKAEFKYVNHANMVQMLEKKKVNYERLWANRLYHQVLDLPHFDQVYRDIKRKLRESNYI